MSIILLSPTKHESRDLRLFWKKVLYIGVSKTVGKKIVSGPSIMYIYNIIMRLGLYFS